MSDKIRIADLPTSTNIDKDSFMIVERPRVGAGTYKTTLGDIQEAITVRASVEQVGKLTTIRVKDITGETETTILTPTAKVVDNGDNTVTIIITDEDGETEATTISRYVFDPVPTEGSTNLVNSGTVWSISNKVDEIYSDLQNAMQTIEELQQQSTLMQEKLEALEDRLEVLSSKAIVVEDGQEIDRPYSVGDEVRFNSLEDAIHEAAIKQTYVKLLSNAISPGVVVPENSNLILDLNNYELTITSPGVGVPETPQERNGLYLEKNNDILIKNGRLTFVSYKNDDGGEIITPIPGDVRSTQVSSRDNTGLPTILSENSNQRSSERSYYIGRLDTGIVTCANLTIDNVIVEGDEGIGWLLVNLYGNTTFKNGTCIHAYGYNTSFLLYYGMLSEYEYPGAFVTLDDNTVSIGGSVGFGKSSYADTELLKTSAGITIPSTMELFVEFVIEPSEWIDNGDGTKTLRYTGDTNPSPVELS